MTDLKPDGEQVALDAIPLLMDRLWTVRQVAAFLSRSVSWVYKAAERGELPRAKGMAWGLRFVPTEVHAYASGSCRDGATVMPMPATRRGGR
jgi:predicted DNA-binding transcriptional regulator AlpA